MPSARELGRTAQLQDLEAVRNLWVKAVTGKPRSNGSFSLKGDATNGDRLPSNKIYVRLDENPQEVLECWNANGIGMRVNTAVFILKIRGEWRVVALEDQGVDQTYGDNAPMVGQPPVDTDVSAILISGKHYKPGSVYQSTSSSLKVKVRPFFYRYFDSVKYWPGTVELDLADYLPSTTDYWAWVWVGINPITETITAKTGTEYSTKAQLTITDLVTIDMTGLIACDAVPVQEGSTAFSIDNKIAFGRHLVELFDTQPTTIGTALIGSGRKRRLEGPITISGALTVSGELIIQ